jgi:hypothetical protein
VAPGGALDGFLTRGGALDAGRCAALLRGVAAVEQAGPAPCDQRVIVFHRFLIYDCYHVFFCIFFIHHVFFSFFFLWRCCAASPPSSGRASPSVRRFSP